MLIRHFPPSAKAWWSLPLHQILGDLLISLSGQTLAYRVGVSPKPPLMACFTHSPGHCEYWLLMAQSGPVLQLTLVN